MGMGMLHSVIEDQYASALHLTKTRGFGIHGQLGNGGFTDSVLPVNVP